MCQCRFILGKKMYQCGVGCSRGGCACVGAGCIWEISVPSQFCCKPKTALLKPVLKRKIKGKEVSAANSDTLSGSVHCISSPYVGKMIKYERHC